MSGLPSLFTSSISTRWPPSLQASWSIVDERTPAGRFDPLSTPASPLPHPKDTKAEGTLAANASRTTAQRLLFGCAMVSAVHHKRPDGSTATHTAQTAFRWGHNPPRPRVSYGCDLIICAAS